MPGVHPSKVVSVFFPKPASKPSLTARSAIEQGGAYKDEGSGDRKVLHQYADPLDLIWLHAAEQLGMRVDRSEEVFASWDGCGTLTLSVASGFDPDDTVAQLVLHECCHALVAGPSGWSAPDWGLENADHSDLAQEYAAHRVQAALADAFGLRRFLAVTTKWREHYDRLGADPLHGPQEDPAVALARVGYERSQEDPWKPVLEQALRSTRDLARLVQPFAPASSLWSVACSAPAGGPVDGPQLPRRH